MKTQIVLLRIAGVINLIFMLFHLAFYHMFHWKSTLNCLSQFNRAIMMTYHCIIILVIGFMGITLLVQTKALLNSTLKYSVLSMFALFYLIRIVTEFTMFGFSWPHSPVIVVMCTVPVIFCAIPLFNKIQ
jgi:hypothetical protein